MTAPEPTPALDPVAMERTAHDRAFLGHPKGLGYLAVVEGCERFSYYSMQTLLTLYMVNYLLLPDRIGTVFGLQWLQAHRYGGLEAQPLSSAIFGDYTALVYLTPILGGMIADRWLGRRTTLILGGLVMSAGHFLMAFEGMFLLALVTLIVGVGLFKGNIASQVGELYKDGDVRRAMAFQIFYIAINVSVIVAPLISGTLGEEVSWHLGFGTAGVVMVIGLAIYLKAGPWLPQEHARGSAAFAEPRPALTSRDWLRIVAVLLLVPIMTASLIVNQQIFNAYMVWADRSFEMELFGIKLPTTWIITIDAALSFSLLVGVAGFWNWYGTVRREPDELTKMVIGSVFSIAGALWLWLAAVTHPEGHITLLWPVMFHFLNSVAFAHILPVSLALFTRLAPRALNATVTGIYYLAFFGANLSVGKIGGWFSTMPTPQFWLVHALFAGIGLAGFGLFKLFVAERLIGKA